MKKVKYVPLKDAPTNFEGYVLVTGFMGFGYVGYLATEYLVNKLNMRKVGFFITKYLPDQVSYSERNGLELPFELYLDEKNKLLVLLNRWIPHEVERFRYADYVVRWSIKHGIVKVYGLGGLDKSFKEEPSETLRWIKTSAYEGPLPDAKPMPEGLKVVGPLAHLLASSEIRGLPMLALLPFCESSRQDPRASATGIVELAKLLNIQVDVSDLMKRAELIEKEIEKLKKVIEMSSGGRESHYM
ncbi:carboxylate-amine ligase [Ignicoccus pacificus DSM 13166]|uniref:Carboxylate-amine ligase n=1 Tax=Ignicoccus pacificus DSM 13166 TaxID=940294 RepID=A0A977K8T1_9CREN|nr:carboxylate-amine ligase [Ignicoccus pacificus DSM 13166]